MISIFDCDELEFIMNGVSEIDIKDWKQNTQYKGEFEA